MKRVRNWINPKGRRPLAKLSWPVVFLCSLVACVWAFSVGVPARAADAKVQFSASFVPSTVRVGEHSTLELKAQVPEGYHLYSLTAIEEGPLQLRFTLEGAGDQLQGVGDWHAPKPKVEIDETFKKAVEYYDGEVVHRRNYLISGATGQRDLKVAIKGQICNPSQCIPVRAKIPVQLTVEAGAARSEWSQAAALDGEAFPPDRPAPSRADGGPPVGDGFWSFVALAFVAGIGALVTPCVFPMIPITVSFFSKFSEVSMGRAVTMAGIYAGSIVGTFTFIGVAVSLIFQATDMQQLSSSVGFNIFLAFLLVFFAFNLFGLFEISVPNWLISKSSEKEFEYKNEEDGSLMQQALGIFFMAVTFTLVSFTCTVGFIGIVLAQATKGSAFYPAVGMFSFSLAFSFPFFILALFPSWANRLSGKGGDWMFAVKAVLGFLELAGAFKFISNVDLLWQSEVITRPVVLTAWTGIFLVCALFLVRLVNLPHSDPDERSVGPIRMVIAIAMFALAAYSFSGIRDTKSMGGWVDSWLPPAIYPGQMASGDHGGDAGHLEWIVNDLPGAMARAKAENKALFVDFTGYTCTNCRYMEGAVFPRPEIKAQLEKMVRLSAYTDCDDPVCEELSQLQQARFDTLALPFYAIINPHTDKVMATHADMTREPKEYEAFLKQGIAKFEQQAQGRAAQVGAAEPGPIVDLEFPTLADGKPFKLSSLRGKWVFLNYWASWCAPCKEELEHVFPGSLAAFPEVELVTVAFDGDDTRESALKFAKKVDLLKSHALIGGDDMEETGLEKALQPGSALPTSFLIDPEGRLVWRLDDSLDRKAMDAVLQRTR